MLLIGTFSEYPVKTVVTAFADAGIDKVLSEPWGRRHLMKGKGTTPSLADQVSFHARVDQKACDTLLACSGHNLVYMIPRRQDHSLQPGYSVIWIGQSKAEALKAALQVPGQLGIVRAKNRYGIRVHEAKHDSTFQQLRPGQTMPSKVAVSHLFRLGPVLPSADATAVQAWATASNWKVKVLKALGPQHWLIGSEVEPPLAYPSFNGQTVLITQVQQRSTQQRIVQAGQLQQKPPPGLTKARPEPEIDPWLFQDPWSKAASFDSRSSVSSLSTSNAPRQLTGPTEARFQQLDSRLQALEAGMQELKKQQEQQHAQLVQMQAEDRDATQAAVTGLKEQLSVLTTDLAAQLRVSTESLQTAQAQQQHQMQSGIDELKALFLTARDTRDPHKKPKLQEQQDEL